MYFQNTMEGRGRGRATMSFSIETLGFGRGESIPVSTQQPPPVYPVNMNYILV